eukprot:87025_1
MKEEHVWQMIRDNWTKDQVKKLMDKCDIKFSGVVGDILVRHKDEMDGFNQEKHAQERKSNSYITFQALEIFDDYVTKRQTQATRNSLMDVVPTNINGTILMAHRKSKFYGGYSKDINIQWSEAVTAKNIYLQRTCNGELESTIKYYSKDLEQQFGIEYATKSEYAVYPKSHNVIAEAYIQLINSTSTKGVWRNHSTDVSDDKLKRKVKESIVIVYDGGNAQNIYSDSGNIIVGAYKWTGCDRRFSSDKGTGTFFLLGNESEDAQLSQLVFRNEVQKIQRIREINDMRFVDGYYREHYLDFSGVTIRKVFDAKALRKYYMFIPSPKPGPDPLLSVIRYCSLVEGDIGYEDQQMYQYHNYEQCTIYTEHIEELDEYDYAFPHISQNLDTLLQYLQNRDDPTKPTIILTHPH